MDVAGCTESNPRYQFLTGTYLGGGGSRIHNEGRVLGVKMGVKGQPLPFHHCILV